MGSLCTKFRALFRRRRPDEVPVDVEVADPLGMAGEDTFARIFGENGGDGGLLEDDDNDTHDEDGDVRYQEDGEHDDGWETLDDDDQDTHDEDGNQEGGGDHTSMYHPSSPDVSQMSEEEQVRMATRLGLIEQLPTGVYRGSMEKRRECVICLVEFRSGDPLRYLPCMHFYHAACVDEWLVRSLTCPSCMEPADANLLVSFVTEE